MMISEMHPYIRNIVTAFFRPSEDIDVLNCPIQAADCRLFYILSGEGKMMVGQKRVSLFPSSVILVQSGCVYQWEISAGNSLNYVSVNFDFTHNFAHLKKSFHPVHADMFSDENILETVLFEDVEILNHPIVVTEFRLIEKKLQYLISEWNMRESYKDEILSSSFKIIILMLLRKVEGTSCEGNKLSLLIHNTIHYIQNNYSLQITNEELAKEFCFNPNYLNRLFKEQTGGTIHQFVIHCRMTAAIDLLCSTNLPVCEIAAQVGFTDAQHFTKTFHRYTGISPREYRFSVN